MIGPGMDHALYPFSALPGRKPFTLPDGKSVAICPVVYLEDWTLDPPDTAHHDPRFGDVYGAFRPDYRTHTWREYGLRVGIFRLFEVLDRHRLTATLAVNSSVAERCPVLIEEALRRGWDIAGHGTYANAMITSKMTPDAIAFHVRSSLDVLEAVSGTRPTGWISQDFSQSADTPQILADAGLRWIADWPNDEQPYVINTDPKILSIPVLSELDDVQLLWHRRVPTPRYPTLISDAFNVLYVSGPQSARVMVLGIHAWLFGMAHRIRYLDEALSQIAEQPGAWTATLGQLADWSYSRISGED
jgi:allantoinase